VQLHYSRIRWLVIDLLLQIFCSLQLYVSQKRWKLVHSRHRYCSDKGVKFLDRVTVSHCCSRPTIVNLIWFDIFNDYRFLDTAHMRWLEDTVTCQLPGHLHFGIDSIESTGVTNVIAPPSKLGNLKWTVYRVISDF